MVLLALDRFVWIKEKKLLMAKLSQIPELAKDDGGKYPYVSTTEPIKVVSHQTGKSFLFRYRGDVDTAFLDNNVGCYVSFIPEEPINSVVKLIIHRDLVQI